METHMFLCLHITNLHKFKEPKHACFQVFPPFSAHIYFIMDNRTSIERRPMANIATGNSHSNTMYPP